MHGEIKRHWTASAEIFGFAVRFKIKCVRLDAFYLYTTDCGCTHFQFTGRTILQSAELYLLRVVDP
jgi:hypothetical protein